MLNPISGVSQTGLTGMVTSPDSTRFARAALASDAATAEYTPYQKRERGRVMTQISPPPRPDMDQNAPEGQHIRNIYLTSAAQLIADGYTKAAEPVLYIVGGEIETLGGVVDLEL
ncbi:MAG: hypothetical protein QF824_05550 [Candidatus Woesearchaeota archaeon]|jgi:hypothetical protein|nr:hypothetical protein [Candidatus Woesearchaeota archaeon]MDP7180706.1 hypothetical protein [Candidatus Woesearchaeota archaeon]|tara:strand:- start:1686 stop:2030 length:345 start_codon:yes stop_codon:yes gene_type:complete